MRLPAARIETRRELAIALCPRLVTQLRWVERSWWVLNPEDGHWYPDRYRYARHDLVYRQAQQLYGLSEAWDVEIDALGSVAYIFDVLLSQLKVHLSASGLPGPPARPS
jgi:hypothetical protein